MLAFESLTPEALLKEVAEFVQQAGDRNVPPSLIAQELASASILPAKSIFRAEPVTTPAEAMRSALAVMVLDNRIHGWLLQNDPQALRQAISALEGYEAGFLAKMRITATLHNAVMAEAEVAPNPDAAEDAPAGIDITSLIDFWSEIREEIGAKSVWSLYTEAGTNPDQTGISGTGLTLAYADHWGKVGTLVTDLPDNPTWRQLYAAADKLIRESGDDHHIYIEQFTQVGQSSTYRLSTGS